MGLMVGRHKSSKNIKAVNITSTTLVAAFQPVLRVSVFGVAAKELK